ncbi:MAG: hypothetical protein H6724_15710 [Sandaracinus sp.]|nr:hypothetical protein [Sandaracinus sp.]
MKKLALVGILSVLGFGCGDDDGGRTGTDSGLTLMDSGTITLPDTGTMMTMDSGTTSRGECEMPLAALPAEVLPRCSAETATCISMATSNAALQACFDADMTPPFVEGDFELDCGLCSTFQLISCGSNNGCGAEWADWNCCLEPCADEACAAGCNSFRDAFVTCIQGLGATCQSADASCFP